MSDDEYEVRTNAIAVYVAVQCVCNLGCFQLFKPQTKFLCLDGLSEGVICRIWPFQK